jgi:hypothetical protein
MRKPLLGLGLALSLGCGASPPAGAFAMSLPKAPVITRHIVRELAIRIVGGGIVDTARKYLGYPYLIDGTSPSTGFSCIGFVSYVYHLHGIALPGGLDEALAFAPQIPSRKLRPGDVLYFQDTVFPGVSHAGIYIGRGKFIHSEWYGRGVVISSFTKDPIDDNYWAGKYLTANRPWLVRPAHPRPPIVRPSPSPKTPTATSRNPMSGRITGTITVPALNLRSGPSTDSDVLEVIPGGTPIVVTGARSSWYKVRLPAGQVGWIAAAYTSVHTRRRPLAGTFLGSPVVALVERWIHRLAGAGTAAH